MNKDTNILVTHGGGSGPIGVIKSLKSINFEGKIVVTDNNDIYAARVLADVHYKVPSSNDKHFPDAIFNIIKKENINLIIPTGDTDLLFFTKNKQKFNTMGVDIFMSDYESVAICLNKFTFYEKCKDKFPLPKTSLDYKDLEFPLFAKPKQHSAGSKGVSLCKQEYNIQCLQHDRYTYIYQEHLPGQEYTIDVLCDMDSNPLVTIPRKRLELNEGVSFKGEIISDIDIENICNDICKFLKLKGPICLQMKEDKDGNLKFVEINPRIGGSTYFTTLAGVNFLEIILKEINQEAYKISKPDEITIARYYEEVIL